jgi:hypothetical protein
MFGAEASDSMMFFSRFISHEAEKELSFSIFGAWTSDQEFHEMEHY